MKINRRDLFKATLPVGLGLGLAATGPMTLASIVASTQTSTVFERRPIYKSLKFGMVQEPGSILEKFQLLAELGYDGVEVDAPHGPPIEELLAAARQSGLLIHGVVDSTHWKDRASDSDPHVRQRCQHDLITAIETSHALGGSSVLFVPGHGKDGSWEEIQPRIHEVITSVLPLASRLGVRVLIENVWNQLFYDASAPPEQSAQAYADFIDSFQSPWVGAYFDIGNHHKYGQPETWIRTLGSRIVKLDVKDFSRTANQFTGLKSGTIHWPAVRSALDEIGYTGWCTAELGGGNRAYLDQLIKDMNELLPSE